ncbi:MAG: KH domain-containing protein [Trueperaceae bacterium]|nr:KH domain-containing protein [Trueperaceae bacterium]
MSDSDLDKYLEGIGIDVDGEEPGEAQVVIIDAVEEFEQTLDVGPIVQGDPFERAESFLVNLLLNIDPAYAVELEQVTDDEIEAEVYGGDPGKLIGRNGRTLAALEYLTNAVVNREEGGRVRVNVDVGGYKRRRDERLRKEAMQAAARVRKSGMAVELEPMSAAERRVVHMALADEPGVHTESRGEGGDRRVVVKPD